MLRARGWKVDEELLVKLQQADRYFFTEQLLSHAVTKESFEDWLEEATQTLSRFGSS